jgi:hypothetical protein
MNIDGRLKRAEQAMASQAPAWPQVFRVIDNAAECERLRAQNPAALIIHRVIVAPKARAA